MKNFETPTDFETSITLNGITIAFNNLQEISQGGPVVGNLLIDNKIVYGTFGGPFLNENEFLFIPIYLKKRFFGWGFKLAKIDLNNGHCYIVGSIKKLIFLDKIEKDVIYFYEDFYKTRFNRQK